MTNEAPDMDRNVTAFFNARDEAEQAIVHLTETGLPRDRILLRTGAARKAAFAEGDKGLLQEVKELILPSEEPDSAVAAVKHEGFLLSVRPEPDSHDAIVKLLEQDGGLGVESREDIWPDWKACADKPPSDDLIDDDPDRPPAPDEAAAEEAGRSARAEAPDPDVEEQEPIPRDAPSRSSKPASTADLPAERADQAAGS